MLELEYYWVFVFPDKCLTMFWIGYSWISRGNLIYIFSREVDISINMNTWIKGPILSCLKLTLLTCCWNYFLNLFDFGKCECNDC